MQKVKTQTVISLDCKLQSSLNNGGQAAAAHMQIFVTLK